MQNAKNLLWPLKGELRELEKEPALPIGNHLKPSPQHLPPADLPLHLRTETISSASSGCPAFSRLNALLGVFFLDFGGFSLDLGVQLSSPLVVLEERGRGHAHYGLKPEIWQLGPAGFLCQELFPWAVD